MLLAGDSLTVAGLFEKKRRPTKSRLFTLKNYMYQIVIG